MDLGQCSWFPNFRSMTLKAHCRWYKNWEWIAPSKPDVVELETPDGYIIQLGQYGDLLNYKRMRRVMEKEIARFTKDAWEREQIGSLLDRVKISFMYSETDEWDEKAPTVPLLSLV